MRPEVLTKYHAATYLGVTVRTLDRMVKAGAAPPRVRIGGRWMFQREDLVAWVNSRRERESEKNVRQDATDHTTALEGVKKVDLCAL